MAGRASLNPEAEERQLHVWEISIKGMAGVSRRGREGSPPNWGD